MPDLSRANQLLLAVALVLVIALLIGGQAGLNLAALVLVVGLIAWPMMRKRE